MEVHYKRKPWHGFRELLKEVGTIVIGVLIALGGEQAVEWLHWRHVVHEERAVLADMSTGVYAVLLTRVDMQPCVDARLADIKTILKRHDAGQPLGINGPIGRPSLSTLSLGPLDMAIADQTLSHMPLDEKTRYFQIKDAYQIFQANAGAELEAWKTLRTLDHARDFTSTDWAEIRRAYDKAADANGVLNTNLKSDSPGEWLYSFRDLPKPRPEDASLRAIPWVQDLCRSGVVG